MRARDNNCHNITLTGRCTESNVFLYYLVTVISFTDNLRLKVLVNEIHKIKFSKVILKENVSEST